MEQHKLQATDDIILKIPLINIDGSQAIGEVANLSTKIIAPDGTALAGYTEATFSEPGGDGVYVVIFSKAAAIPAFTLEDEPNSYTVVLDSSTADVEPTSRDVWIVSQLTWEAASKTTGNRIVTLHIEDAVAAPIPDVFVRVTDGAGLITIGTGTTDINGDVVLALDDEDYQAVLRKAMVNFTVPEPFTVTGDATFDFVGNVISPSAPTQPDTCVVFGNVVDVGGSPFEEAEIFINEPESDTFANTLKVVQNKQTTSDATGFWELEIIRSSQLDPNTKSYNVIIKARSFKFKTTITVPDQDSVEFSTIVGT
ncbi:hypothetical protein KAR91_16705 [Candidatus Pacearchaeota archaeon]|nr:hypothetical protein [Candidatus Pacearchaeota archaeon]